MANILLFTLIIILVTVANVMTRLNDQRISKLFFSFLFLLNLPVFVIGLLFVVIPAEQLQTIQPAANVLDLQNPTVYGVILQGMAVWGILVTVGASRHSLFKRTHINPNSPIHGLAMMLSGYLVGNVLLIMSQGGLDQLAETAVPASIISIVLSAFIFAPLGFAGVGLFVRRNWRPTLKRLGLIKPSRAELLLGVRWIFGLVLLQWVVGAVWAGFNPDQATQVAEVNDILLANVDTVWEWALLALSAGVGEEVLFRGAIQPVLGLPLTAVLFALGHVQYGFTPITLLVFVLGVILGRIRQQTNTTVAIFVHAGYNFILGLVALSVPYLEQWAEQTAWIIGNW